MELVVTRHVTRTVWSYINYRVDLDQMTKEFNETLKSYDNADELPVLTPDLLARIIKDELDDSNPEDRAVIDAVVQFGPHWCWGMETTVRGWFDDYVWESKWEDVDDEIDDWYDEYEDESIEVPDDEE